MTSAHVGGWRRFLSLRVSRVGARQLKLVAQLAIEAKKLDREDPRSHVLLGDLASVDAVTRRHPALPGRHRHRKLKARSCARSRKARAARAAKRARMDRVLSLDILVFELGTRTYGVDLRAVREVLRCGDHPGAAAPAAVVGR